MSGSSSLTRRGRVVLLSVVVAVIAGTVALGALGLQRLGRSLDDLLVAGTSCGAEVDGHEVSLDSDQAAEAAVISAVSVRRGLPARAASIALASSASNLP